MLDRELVESVLGDLLFVPEDGILDGALRTAHPSQPVLHHVEGPLVAFYNADNTPAGSVLAPPFDAEFLGLPLRVLPEVNPLDPAEDFEVALPQTGLRHQRYKWRRH